jgi:Golgi nucleoside diphosphatase
MKEVVEKTLKFLDTVKEIRLLESGLEQQNKRQEELAAKLKPGRRTNPFKSDSWTQFLTENKETEP